MNQHAVFYFYFYHVAGTIHGVRSTQFAIGTTSANSVESDLGCTSTVYFDNVALTSQKLCQRNNKFDCSETNGYIPQDAI